MTTIKFASDYGFAPAAPFFLVWCEGGNYPRFKHETRELAEAEAARLAGLNPSSEFHVLGVMSTIVTSPDIVGRRFDPNRLKPQPVAAEPEPLPPEFAEVEEPTPAFVDEFADDQPF